KREKKKETGSDPKSRAEQSFWVKSRETREERKEAAPKIRISVYIQPVIIVYSNPSLLQLIPSVLTFPGIKEENPSTNSNKFLPLLLFRA
uniref:Uncharacterized protein n=1 Tax=Cucumis melo TaxID=3656 RepID=A0A9I9EI60_CUCME